MELAKRVIDGDRRAAARLITLVENNDPDAERELKKLYRFTGRAHVIGITGPPGAGKSTVTDKAAGILLNVNKTVGIIAVDPTSPFTGGAILGDRIRMQDLATNPNIFIRSMGTRGHLGGIASATNSAVKVLDALGCQYIFVETVGVGQSEIDIVKTADTTVLVLVPGLGDDIQAIKAGIMEIGDIFVVNKADRDGADRTAAEINAALDFYRYDRRPPVIKTAASLGLGVENLVAEIDAHMAYLKDADRLGDVRKDNSKVEILELAVQRIKDMVLGDEGTSYVEELSSRVSAREMDPYTAAAQILKRIGIGGGVL